MKHLRWTEWLPNPGGNGPCWHVIPFKTRCGRIVDEGRTTESLNEVECKHCQRIAKKLAPGVHIRIQAEGGEV